MATSLVQVRIDEDLKTQASEIYDALGIDLSTAVRMFLKRSVMVNGIPFSMVIPKQEAKAGQAIAALQELSRTAQQNGTADMTLGDINIEISEARKNR